LVIGLTVVSAQDAAAIQKLTDDFLAGRITLPEFERRMVDVEKEYTQTEQRTQQQAQQQPQQTQQQPQQQGANAGWPPASAYQALYGSNQLRQLKQPAGTTARYDQEGVGVRIYLTGGNANTVIQDLKRQIETIVGTQHTGRQMYDNGGTFSTNFNDGKNGTAFWLSQEGGTVELSINNME
jgi:hypothetical protein